MSSKYILQNLDNYNKSISDSYSSIIYKYIDLINNYIILSFDNSYIYNNNKYIIKKGIETLHHVFNIIFLYTLNLELTCYHCEKATYYYIEFISQMSGDNNILQLTSKDVTLFVFKKTIFDISNGSKNKYTISNIDSILLKLIKKISNIYNELTYMIIDDNSAMSENNIVNNNDNELQRYKTQLSIIYKTINVLLNSNLDENKEDYLLKLNMLEFMIQILNERNYQNKLIIIDNFIRKLFGNTNSTFNSNINIEMLKNKVYDEKFENYVMNNHLNKLMTWIFN